MRKFTRRTTVLLTAGALTIATAPVVHAQTLQSDFTIPLGGSCVVNVTHARIDGDCTLQFLGGVAAAALAVLGVGSLGSSDGSNGAPGNPPTTPPTTPVTPPTTTPAPPDSSSGAPYLAENYTFSSSEADGFGVVGVEYIGEVPANPGTISLRHEGAEGEFIFNPDTPLTEGMGGYWILGTHGRFVVVYTPIGEAGVDVAWWNY